MTLQLPLKDGLVSSYLKGGPLMLKDGQIFTLEMQKLFDYGFVGFVHAATGLVSFL